MNNTPNISAAEQKKRDSFFNRIKAELDKKGFNDELPQIRQLKKNVKLITQVNNDES